MDVESFAAALGAQLKSHKERANLQSLAQLHTRGRLTGIGLVFKEVMQAIGAGASL